MLGGVKRTLLTEPADRKPLRLLPGIVIVALQWILWLVVPAVGGFDVLVIGLMGGLAGGLAVLVWWAFFSRAPGVERIGAVLLMIVSLAVVSSVQHESMAAAQLGLTMFFYAVPILSLAFVVWAVVARRLAVVPRRATMVAVIVVSSVVSSELFTTMFHSQVPMNRCNGFNSGGRGSGLTSCASPSDPGSRDRLSATTAVMGLTRRLIAFPPRLRFDCGFRLPRSSPPTRPASRLPTAGGPPKGTGPLRGPMPPASHATRVPCTRRRSSDAPPSAAH